MSDPISPTRTSPTWEWVFEALAGRPARISFVEQAEPSTNGDAADRILLPRRAPYRVDGLSDTEWRRLAIAHRAAHYEFGTFAFDLAGLRGVLEVSAAGAGRVGRAQYDGESDLEYVFAHLSERVVAERIFTDLEDFRVEAGLARMYRGAGGLLFPAHKAELSLRREISTLSPRAYALELLCRRSLRWAPSDPDVPRELAPIATLIDVALEDVGRVRATVAQSVLWTVRLHREIARLPMISRPARHSDQVSSREVPRPKTVARLDWEQHVELEGADSLGSPLAPIPTYRDGLGFRHTTQSRVGRIESSSVFRFTFGLQSAQEQLPVEADIPDTSEALAERPRRPEPGEHEHYDLIDHHYHAPVGRLLPAGGRSFLYPEWDRNRGSYRRAWCRVREVWATAMERQGDRLYQRVLRQYHKELSQLRKRTQGIIPEGRRSVRRTRWGDDIDIDAAVEAMVDSAAGLPPSPNVHVARERSERDAAVVVLFDVSSSTAERIPIAEQLRGDSEKSGEFPLSMSASKRILDLELEAMALLLAALSATGDQCGVYGFSSSGRDDVQFVIVKDVGERLSTHVLGRLDGIMPIHSTRIGPAVRHATHKLKKAQASTRILLVVTDGRPYDLDYAPDGREVPDIAYAVADTRRALNEAADTSIRVKVLGIDHSEQHWIREMCGSRIAFELLPRVELLPLRIVSLYRDLVS